MTKDLAQGSITVPQFGTVNGPPKLKSDFKDLGSLASGIIGLVFTIAAFIAFFYMIFGALQYLLAGGDKSKVEAARKRIMWAVVGLLILSLSFAITQLIQQVLVKPGFVSPIGMASTAYAAGTDLKSAYAFGQYNSLGDLVSTLTPVVFSFATIIVIFYFLIAAFQLIVNSGDKEALGKARTRITHSIIGFVLLMMVYIGLQYLMQFFGLEFNIFFK